MGFFTFWGKRNALAGTSFKKVPGPVMPFGFDWFRLVSQGTRGLVWLRLISFALTWFRLISFRVVVCRRRARRLPRTRRTQICELGALPFLLAHFVAPNQRAA